MRVSYKPIVYSHAIKNTVTKIKFNIELIICEQSIKYHNTKKFTKNLIHTTLGNYRILSYCNKIYIGIKIKINILRDIYRDYCGKYA